MVTPSSVRTNPPIDQADGLRRMFAGTRVRFVPVLSNPHVASTDALFHHLMAAFATQGLHTLLVDAGEHAPPPPELSVLGLTNCIEPMSRDASYLAARGLPLRYVDTRGSTHQFLDAVVDAAPHAQVVLVHASASDLARLFARRPERVLLLACDHPASVTHAYAGMKLLATRAHLMVFDLLLAAAASSPRVDRIADQLQRCADQFLGAVLHAWADIDPANAVDDKIPAALEYLVQHTLHRPPLAGRDSESAAVQASLN